MHANVLWHLFLRHISIVAELRLFGAVMAVPESRSYTGVGHALAWTESPGAVIELIKYRQITSIQEMRSLRLSQGKISRA